jgi:hypothetical protein
MQRKKLLGKNQEQNFNTGWLGHGPRLKVLD